MRASSPGKRAATCLQKFVVDEIDDLQMPRQHALNKRHGPLLKRFGKHRVIGVAEGPDSYIPGLVPAHVLFVGQEPHELGNCKGRMRVIELDCDLFGQRFQIAVFAFKPPQNILYERQRRESIPA